ncbi:hypothetical protein MRB53_007719 [Persea americana]|uniref:Uncharacterized protein n=1 Tax=Persea americana TaxID=3435 RepID=A0ACC2MJP0_PERAE|nr:hypothetical protein MRB53_007719 [Persea americana]
MQLGPGAIARGDEVQRIDFCANRSPKKAACTPPSSPNDVGRGRQSSPVSGKEAARRCSVHGYVAETEPVKGRRRSHGPSQVQTWVSSGQVQPDPLNLI